ncbi:DUF4142 domain-containing protein [Amycolatopsis sp. H20-H5]|uniref:DUF4142 domain-containing protein n=1 Tax=Amycolatopsis sp. H20-H5 TaxID=3046309 RepID=UPI002DBD4BE7|nr:DUF4142 domain-containing protein [Amycolatopsis sp. H20-H5]MEC3976044.1 DUF4142 domain-containing protein [Amycolatopsis sp. H20-H5]
MRLPSFVLVVLLLALSVLTQLAATGNARAAQPLTTTDQTLLTKVRQAGLWEMPAGRWAETRGASPRVKEVGMMLMIDHGRLDTATRALAAELTVALPAQPTAEQQGWLNEMNAAKTPAEFDQIFVNRLRAAHGTVFSVISAVRAATRNDKIREFATTANQAVLRHISLLESTGLVDYGRLPDAVLPAATTTPLASAALDIQATDILTGVVLAVVLGGTTVFGLRLIRGSRRRAAARAGKTEFDPPLTAATSTGDVHG